MARHELAQLNVARLSAPIDSPQLADFVNALDRINALADAAPGAAALGEPVPFDDACPAT